MMEKDISCRQCGTCCRKGGPSFHLEDRTLIDGGLIQAKNLFTIRAGELAHENVRGTVSPVATDIIKIKGKNNSWECIFFNGETNNCDIYALRPAECRALLCKDTRKIEALYRHHRLTRRDILEGVTGLWELIEDHQQRCDYQKIFKLTGRAGNTIDAASREKLLEIIGYDTQIRLLTTERGSLDPALTDFLFGRPLTITLPLMGVSII